MLELLLLPRFVTTTAKLNKGWKSVHVPNNSTHYNSLRLSAGCFQGADTWEAQQYRGVGTTFTTPANAR